MSGKNLMNWHDIVSWTYTFTKIIREPPKIISNSSLNKIILVFMFLKDEYLNHEFIFQRFVHCQFRVPKSII